MPALASKPKRTNTPGATRAASGRTRSGAERRPAPKLTPDHLGLVIASRSLTITAATGEEDTAPARFAGVVYSGGPLNTWDGVTYLDLEGMTARLPGAAMFNHGWCFNGEHPELGVVETIEVTELGLEAGGYFLDNDTGMRVSSTGAQGYPWEMSVHAEASDYSVIEIVGSGESAEVNGRTAQGPCLIYRKWTLRESTICHLGLDPNTALSVAAALQRSRPHSAPGSTNSNEGDPMSTTAKKPGATGTPAASPKTPVIAAKPKVKVTASEETEAEMVDPADITLEWLQENKPELVDEIQSAGEDDEDPAATEASASAIASVGTPATIEQLRTLKGGDAEFREECIMAKLTLEAAALKLNERLAAKLAEKGNAAQASATSRADVLKQKASGVAPLKLTAGAEANSPKVFSSTHGETPEEDWAASEELRGYWKGLVMKANKSATDDDARRAFLRAAKSAQKTGEPWNVRH